MPAASPAPIAIVHLDESCLGNGREGANPGGAGALIELQTAAGIQRRDFSVHAADTTNNRMALTSALAVLTLLGGKGRRLRVLCVSDSQYLVRGVREWLPGWKARGWKRKGGTIENLGLWQDLDRALQGHETVFTWVRGHVGTVKNEYADHLAVTAARMQQSTPGAVPSGFAQWLALERAKERYLDYDPDAAFLDLRRLVASSRRIPLDLAVALEEAS